MIPLFDVSGALPPGVHTATLAEIEARFGRQSELRRVQMESVRWMVDLARRAGVRRIVLNGSFVTDIMEPNDVDCVLLIGAGAPKDQAAEDELLEGLPFWTCCWSARRISTISLTGSSRSIAFSKSKA